MSRPGDQIIPNPDFYITGGTMNPAARSYIVRRADEELYNLLLAGEFCYVLTTRQMGKSSLMAHTAVRLSETGVQSVQVDLTTIGGGGLDVTAGNWYYGLAYAILKGLKIQERLDSWWQQRPLLPVGQRFIEFLDELVLDSIPGRIVVFVDEIDFTLQMPFCDDFFVGIRAIYNARAAREKFTRLAFLLLGVATPAQLIKDTTRTPFNIGNGIELTDFVESEAENLALGLSADNLRRRRFLRQILRWTGGHPYLTQALCRIVAETEAMEAERTGEPPESIVDQLVQQKFLTTHAVREEMNLKFVGDLLRKGHPDRGKVLEVYRDVLLGKAVRDEPTYAVHAALKLSGVAKPDDSGMLRVRNLVYERAFDQRWIREEMPSQVVISDSQAPFVQLGKHLPSFVEIDDGLPRALLHIAPSWYPGIWAPPAVTLTVSSMLLLSSGCLCVLFHPLRLPERSRFSEVPEMVVASSAMVLALVIVLKCASRPGPSLPRIWALTLAGLCCLVTAYVGITEIEGRPLIHGLGESTLLGVLMLLPRLIHLTPYDRVTNHIAPLTLTLISLLALPVWWVLTR